MGEPTGVKAEYDPLVQRMAGVTVHGFIPFDVPFASEIADNLWQGGCRNGLILPRFIGHLVSLHPWETYKVKHELDSHLAVRMHDTADQPTGQVDLLAAWVNSCRESGPVLVHCQAGLNRSALVTARALMLAGATADEAIGLIREKRSAACLCNPAFEAHLRGIEAPCPT
jgi:protein-tyrosine phosphatase